MRWIRVHDGERPRGGPSRENDAFSRGLAETVLACGGDEHRSSEGRVRSDHVCSVCDLSLRRTGAGEAERSPPWTHEERDASSILFAWTAPSRIMRAMRSSVAALLLLAAVLCAAGGRAQPASASHARSAPTSPAPISPPPPTSAGQASGVPLHIHVRGTAELHAVATADHGELTLHGELIDDAGTPIAGAPIGVQAFDEGGKAALRVGPLRACDEVAGRPPPRGSPDDLVVETDDRGGFCAIGRAPAPKMALKLRFRGSKLHDGADISRAGGGRAGAPGAHHPPLRAAAGDARSRPRVAHGDGVGAGRPQRRRAPGPGRVRPAGQPPPRAHGRARRARRRRAHGRRRPRSLRREDGGAGRPRLGRAGGALRGQRGARQGRVVAAGAPPRRRAPRARPPDRARRSRGRRDPRRRRHGRPRRRLGRGRGGAPRHLFVRRSERRERGRRRRRRARPREDHRHLSCRRRDPGATRAPLRPGRAVVPAGGRAARGGQARRPGRGAPGVPRRCRDCRGGVGSRRVAEVAAATRRQRHRGRDRSPFGSPGRPRDRVAAGSRRVARDGHRRARRLAGRGRAPLRGGARVRGRRRGGPRRRRRSRRLHARGPVPQRRPPDRGTRSTTAPTSKPCRLPASSASRSSPAGERSSSAWCAGRARRAPPSTERRSRRRVTCAASLPARAPRRSRPGRAASNRRRTAPTRSTPMSNATFAAPNRAPSVEPAGSPPDRAPAGRYVILPRWRHKGLPAALPPRLCWAGLTGHVDVASAFHIVACRPENPSWNPPTSSSSSSRSSRPRVCGISSSASPKSPSRSSPLPRRPRSCRRRRRARTSPRPTSPPPRPTSPRPTSPRPTSPRRRPSRPRSRPARSPRPSRSRRSPPRRRP